jgi:DNA-binding beta-propeller fold protein YncE
MIASARRLVLCAAAALALTPAHAAAAGPPLPSPDSGRAGAVAPGGSERLLAHRAGDDTTVVAVRRGSGRVLRSRRVSGRWSVPAAALDGATTGLSADGATLVLARPVRSFPPASTRLAVLDARRLAVRRRIALRGFFTVDAISPDGRRLYLVQYGDDVLDYRVRALDTGAGRLLDGDVVDPREPGEQMGGLPMTRAVSRDGRWAYTLYGGGEETFIHALDTVGRTAACIDLEMLAPGADLGGVRLRVSADGRRLDVRDGGRAVAAVDTRTFAVSEPGASPQRPAPAPARQDAAPSTGGFPWAVPAIVVLAAALWAVAARLKRPDVDSNQGSTPEGEGSAGRQR